MNLHVNLILDSELRSSSRVSSKFIIRISAVVVASVFLLVITFVLLGAHTAKSSLYYAEQEQKQLDPVFRTVNELKKELTVVQNLTNAIATWSQTRVDFPVLFSGIQTVVPESIQLTRMTISESLAMMDGAPNRSVTMYFQGKTGGEHAEADVQDLEKNLKLQPPFNEIIDSAKVKQFEAAKIAGQSNMRVFDIECRFKARKLFQPVMVNPVNTK